MRRRTKLVLMALAAGALLFFFLAPVVYAPSKEYVDISSPYYVPGYQSLSCSLFGIGAGYSTYISGGPYQLSCPPPVIIG